MPRTKLTPLKLDSPGQLDRDIVFSTNDNPKVKNLNKWRDRVTFHNDERELLRTRPFEDDNPLPFADIEELLEEGFQLLNRYSHDRRQYDSWRQGRPVHSCSD